MADSGADDAVLVRRVAEGDRAAFDTLFQRHQAAVKAVAVRVLRDEALAEDVVQDAFAGFWHAPHKFDTERGSLRTFLVTVGHRRAVDVVRSEVARSRREQKPPDPVYFDLEEEVWSRSLSEKVRLALDELAENERAAIGLAYFGGLSYVEVAKRLGQPEGSVKSRIRSGMRKLSVLLEEVTP